MALSLEQASTKEGVKFDFVLLQAIREESVAIVIILSISKNVILITVMLIFILMHTLKNVKYGLLHFSLRD